MALNQQSDRNRYPWRNGNRFELLVDGGRFFPVMLTAIKAARLHILLEMYLFGSGRIANDFISALCDAAARGVQVYLLLDDFGARELHRHDRQRLLDAGVRLTLYNPLRYGGLRRNLWRDHRKLLVVDGDTAFVGGAGITDEFSAANPRHWHDVMITVRGPCVADWQRVFEQTWNNWAQPLLTLPPLPLTPRPSGHPGRVTINEPTRMEIKRDLVKRVRNAERRVWIATAYFIPSWKIRRALRHAAQQGADVNHLALAVGMHRHRRGTFQPAFGVGRHR